jgi:imidazolonepropionase-like amidohydrolase
VVIAALLVLTFASAAAQDEETVALTNLRIITVTKGEIESGTIVIKGDKIAALGADVKPPAGARIVDGKGLVAFPGMVHPYSRLGLSDAGGAPAGVTPQHLAFDELNPSLDVFAQAARTGVTTFVVVPTGSGIAGQGLVLKPAGWTREEQVIEKSAVLRIVLQPGTASKEALRQALEGAKKAIEGEKKTPPAKPDDRMAPLARFLKGELPGLVEVASAAELLHFWQVMEAFSDFKPRIIFAASPEVYKAAAGLGSRKARVILRPLVALAPFTRERINTAAELVKAGAEVAFAPLSDAPEALHGGLFRIAELVKYGLPREAALRAVTIVPAEIAGIEKRVGSIEAGKDADLVLFSGDPLSSQSRIREVYINGKPVYHGE